MSEEKGVIHIIPLKRVYWGRKTNRADRAVRLIRKYIARHFKEADKIWIDPRVNEYIWSRSREKPPRRIAVEVRIHRDEEEGVTIAKVLLLRKTRVKKQA